MNIIKKSSPDFQVLLTNTTASVKSCIHFYVHIANDLSEEYDNFCFYFRHTDEHLFNESFASQQQESSQQGDEKCSNCAGVAVSSVAQFSFAGTRPNLVITNFLFLALIFCLNLEATSCQPLITCRKQERQHEIRLLLQCQSNECKCITYKVCCPFNCKC